MKGLTSRERLERCYYHQELDRPGVYVRRGWPKDDATYDRLIELIDGKTDLKFHWGLNSPSGVRTETRTEPVSEDWQRQTTVMHTPGGDLEGTRLISLKGQPGLDESYFIKDEGDVEKWLSLPMPTVGGDCSSFFSAREAAGERGIMDVAIGANPGGGVVTLCGSETFAILSITRRDLVHQMLERRTQILEARLKYMLSQGVGPFFGMSGQEYIAPPLHGPRDFDEFNVAYDRRLTDLVHEAGGRVHVHCHGSLRRLLKLFVKLGVDVLHPVEPPPLCDCPAADAKKVFAGKVTIEGNIQIADIYEAPVEEIERQTRALIKDVFYDRRGLIVCPTASPYIRGAGEQCYANFECMIETVLAAS